MPKLNKATIIAEVNKIKADLRYNKLDISQKTYILRFLGHNRKRISLLLSLILVEVFISLLLPTISQLYLSKSFALIDYGKFLIIAAILIFSILIYLVNSYFRIFLSETLTLKFINKIRKDWYADFLIQSAARKNHTHGRKLMTKLLFHVQLLRIGINNVVYSGVETVLLFLGIMLFAFVFNSKLFLIIWLALPVLIILFLIMDYIGRYYVSREQTFNSRIVAHLADSMINFSMIKSQTREKQMFDEFENYLELDAYFRIRRQLWINFSNRLLYGLMLLFGIGMYFVQIYWPFFYLDSVSSVAATTFIMGFFAKVVFSTARIGIFFEALRLGLRLAIPFFAVAKIDKIKEAPKWNILRFHSGKTKLSQTSSYIKKLEIIVKRGERILIYGGSNAGKTTLAKVFAGLKSISSIIIDVDGKRTMPDKWCRYRCDNYFVNANQSFDWTLGEFLFGKGKNDITSTDMDRLYSVLYQHSFFSFIFKDARLLSRRITKDNMSSTNIMLLQIAYLLLNAKSLVIIDVSGFTENVALIKAINLLDTTLGMNSTLVVFDLNKNKILNYEKVLFLDSSGIQKK
jgi:ABC-type multidrug transport system fused ATPase/permease subunit